MNQDEIFVPLFLTRAILAVATSSINPPQKREVLIAISGEEQICQTLALVL